MDVGRPVVGITVGDICGIGPEIVARALTKETLYDRCRPLVVGPARAMNYALSVIGAENFRIHQVRCVEEAKFTHGLIDVYDVPLCQELKAPIYGQVTVVGGDAAFQAVKKVIELAMEGELDATVTGPLNKEAMNLAGHHYDGHTEIYAKLTGTKSYAMLLVAEKLRVIHVSTHVSLRKACDRVKKARVLEVIRLADEACRSMGIQAPRIGVAGLNPHAGENGMFGDEEQREIIPAVEEAKREGLIADGPIPPDTVFSKALGGMYDIVVAMYHDQGHIPLKMTGFVYDDSSRRWSSVSGVNITLGLPIIRTSVDHGTAFDQAGKGTASCLSLENAIGYAIQMAKAKRRGH